MPIAFTESESPSILVMDLDIARRSEDGVGHNCSFWFTPHVEREGRKATDCA